MSAQYAHYNPQPEDARLTRALMQHLQDATPGGISREQFVRRDPAKTALAAIPFVAFAVAAAFAIITR